ncbi:hypothetical protein [Lewinella sp. W8]|uniref:hypothetical protein n=1 Tax=Lewinella sp. W8 TaxID=2528208 RepID=UPI00106888EE|nr:hypothetical protein [Lewinella sp. W8]MTB51154.1 hypothetical protein [Lewinella sp. W8]
MKREDLASLSETELRQKEKSTKTFLAIFAILIAGLLFFQIRDYLMSGEVETSISIITLCTFGGMASVYPHLKMIREELQSRQA